MSSLTSKNSTSLIDLSEDMLGFEVCGPDALDFLQALSSNDLKILEVGRGHANALLDRNARIISLFHLFLEGEGLYFLGQKKSIEQTYDKLEGLHFSEDLVIKKPETKTIWALQGASSLKTITGSCLKNPPQLYDPLSIKTVSLAEKPARLMSLSLYGDIGFVLAFDEKVDFQVSDSFKSGSTPHEADTLKPQRIEAGLATLNLDYDEKTPLYELDGRASMYSLKKGCFPGQEILARIDSRHKAPRKLMGLSFSLNTPLKNNSIFHTAEGEEIELKSCASSPTLNKNIALVYLKRNYFEKVGDLISGAIDGLEANGTVCELPFYQSPHLHECSEQAYQKGIANYHSDSFESALNSFDLALRLNTHYPDALEAKALVLEKLNRLDDSIAQNKKLSQMVPDSVMAHANLSRLYMLMGNKEKAEEEQNRATEIKFKKAKNEKGQIAANPELLKRAENERKVKIFKQVLEMDADDEIAHFGMGRIHIENKLYSEAVQHLEKVIQQNPNYSAAFDLLAQALISSGRKDRALEVIAQGMLVAQKQGDLMPLQGLKKKKSQL